MNAKLASFLERLAFAALTAFVTLAAAVGLSRALGSDDLERRIEVNSAVTVSATDSIICILQLGVGPADPPRTHENVQKCLAENGYVNIPTVNPRG